MDHFEYDIEGPKRNFKSLSKTEKVSFHILFYFRGLEIEERYYENLLQIT